MTTSLARTDEVAVRLESLEAVTSLVLARDGHECQVRLEGRAGPASDVDHIVPWLAGGARHSVGPTSGHRAAIAIGLA